MSVNKYDSTTGTLTTLATGDRTWVGTKAAYDAQKQAGTLPNDCLIVITDDEVEMDTVPTKDSSVAVTSDGIYNALQWKQIDKNTDLRTIEFNEISIFIQFYTGSYYNFSCLTWPSAFLSGYKPMNFTFGAYGAKALYNGSSTSGTGILDFNTFTYSGTDISDKCDYSFWVR